METIRNVRPNEIDRLKTLVDDKEYFESDNIWYEQSKICTNDEGEILGFALIKPHSLYDFFGGEIPLEEGVEEEMKWMIKESVENLKDYHYEVLFYMKSMEMNKKNDEIYLKLFNGIDVDENKRTIGLLWTPNIIEYDWKFYHFNNVVYLRNFSAE